MVTAEIEDIETDYAIPTAIIYTNGIVAAVWREQNKRNTGDGSVS